MMRVGAAGPLPAVEAADKICRSRETVEGQRVLNCLWTNTASSSAKIESM